MRYNSFFPFLLILLIISCVRQGPKTTGEIVDAVSHANDTTISKKSFIQNSRLLNFKIEQINTIGDLYSRDSIRYNEIFSKDLVPGTDTVRYSRQKIFVTCIRPANGCAEYNGDLRIQNDTITLLLKNISGDGCKEMEEWRTTYQIENRDNKKYIIQKGY